MKYDSVRLLSTPDFGNLNAASVWQYVSAPVTLMQETKKNDRDRYITLLGGDMRNTMLLGGEAEIALGRNPDDLRVFKFEKAVAAFIPAGLFYSVAIREIGDPKFPILYNELVFSPSVKESFSSGRDDYESLFKFGEALWFRYPIHPSALCPRASFTSRDFGGVDMVRRRWTPVLEAYEPESGTHTHTYDTFLTFTGTDPENMLDLGGEIELTIGEGGKELITFSSTVACHFFIKSNLLHGLPVFKKIINNGRPILMTETAFTDSYDSVGNSELPGG